LSIFKNRSLHLITDRSLYGERSLEDMVQAALRGGVSVVQLREKNASTQELIQLATQLKKILQPYSVPLIINDRPDVALATKADGVHIGQDDMPYPTVRKLLGQQMIIGLSINTLEQAKQAENWDVNYLGVGPIFPTTSKDDAAEPLGIMGLKKIRQLSRHTLIAIGGINHKNITDVIQSGADGIAVVSAICAASDPQQSAQQLSHAMQ